VRPSGSVQLLHMEKPATLWLPTTPDLHLYVTTCNIGVKLSKMVGNSASCLLKSWSADERHSITIWISGERHTRSSLHSQDILYFIF